MFSEQKLFNFCSPCKCWTKYTMCAGFSMSAMSLEIVLDQYLLFLADRLSVQSLFRSVLKPVPGSLQALVANLSSLRSKAKPSFWCRSLTLHLSQHDPAAPQQSHTWTQRGFPPLLSLVGPQGRESIATGQNFAVALTAPLESSEQKRC